LYSNPVQNLILKHISFHAEPPREKWFRRNFDTAGELSEAISRPGGATDRALLALKQFASKINFSTRTVVGTTVTPRSSIRSHASR
jgi:hypothetical protein